MSYGTSEHLTANAIRHPFSHRNLYPISENIAQAVGAGHMDAFNGGCKSFLIKFLKFQDIGSHLLQDVFRNLLAGTILSPLHIVGSAYPHRFGINCINNEQKKSADTSPTKAIPRCEIHP